MTHDDDEYGDGEYWFEIPLADEKLLVISTVTNVTASEADCDFCDGFGYYISIYETVKGKRENRVLAKMISEDAGRELWLLLQSTRQSDNRVTKKETWQPIETVDKNASMSVDLWIGGKWNCRITDCRWVEGAVGGAWSHDQVDGGYGYLSMMPICEEMSRYITHWRDYPRAPEQPSRESDNQVTK